MTPLLAREAGGEYDRMRAAETRLEMIIACLISLVVLGSLAYIDVLFAPIAPHARLWPWSAYMAAVAALMVGAPLFILARGASDSEVLRLWAPLGKAFAILLDIGVAASVWLLLPYASEQLRLVMVVLYSALITGQLVTQADSSLTTAFGVIAVFGSTALFFLLSPGQYSGSLGFFLLAFGLLLIGMSFVLKNAIRSAIRSRMNAEDASRELGLALAEASAAQAAKTRFIAAATHDLRQPLQAAALFFDQALRGRDTAARRAATEGCRLALLETNAILLQLLDHLRLDSGAVELRVEPASAQDLLTRVAREMAPAAEAENVTLKVSPTALDVAADPELALRGLRNFLTNALRHARCARVLLAARRTASGVRLYVIDDGVGVAAEERARLFEEYAQGRRASGVGGMGLGLASARRLAELMGGAAGLDTAWRRGAAFYLQLPAA